ncbi:unnamed protein product [Hydatigera taeniaeformis]|uniref:C2-C2_1 domain-containing protein n=1 Tax=Hydatigena taeniaeformis TaxID=6205 RepID=A0A0R3X3P5_HYDTA|nr:unnamed protein product [Hydatigera taeniaeformis]
MWLPLDKERAIKLLNNQNVQLKSRIKELELAMKNQDHIIRDKDGEKSASQQRDGVAENIEIIRLRRQLMEKEKEIERLSAQLALTMEEMKLTGTEEHSTSRQEFQAEAIKSNELQVKLRHLENLVAKYERENEDIRESNAQIPKSSTVQESDPKTVSLLLEKLQRLERRMSDSRGDREKQYEEMRRIHSTLQTRARSAEARIEALYRRLEEQQPSRNLQELCKSVGLDVEDLEAALIRMSGQKDYLVESIDGTGLPWTSKTPQNEVVGCMTENIHTKAAEGLDRANRLPDAHHQMPEEHGGAMESATLQMDPAPIDTDTRFLESWGGRLMKPSPQLAPPVTINLGEMNLTPVQLEACPYGIFCAWRFYSFETQSTGVVRGKRSNFNLTVQYPVITDELFWTYLHKGRCFVKLHRVLPDLSSEEIGEFELGLHYLLRPESYAPTNAEGPAEHPVRVSRVGQFRATKHGQNVEESKHQQLVIGQVIYWMGFRAPIDYSLRYYFKQHQRRKSKDSGDASIKTADRNKKKRLLIELSVEEFMPHVNFCFAYTFWRCSEYVSSAYKPPASDVRLITLKDSPQLDRHLRSSSLKVLLTEGKVGSCLGVVCIPLSGLAEGGGSVNGTFEVYQQPSKSPKIPPIKVRMQWESGTATGTRRINTYCPTSLQNLRSSKAHFTLIATTCSSAKPTA